MTNVSGTPRKRELRRMLFTFGVEALEAAGWTVSRIPRGGKASLRQIKRGGETAKVSIRTSQDTWFAFPRDQQNGWVTLDDVDYVLVVSVDDRHSPTEALAHLIPGDEARARFNRAYAARKRADYAIPVGRGIWISLYEEEASEPVVYVGAGLGIQFPPLARRKLADLSLPKDDEPDDEDAELDPSNPVDISGPTPTREVLTIPEAKRRLAESLGVPESAIRISIEH